MDVIRVVQCNTAVGWSGVCCWAFCYAVLSAKSKSAISALKQKSLAVETVLHNTEQIRLVSWSPFIIRYAFPSNIDSKRTTIKQMALQSGRLFIFSACVGWVKLKISPYYSSNMLKDVQVAIVMQCFKRKWHVACIVEVSREDFRICIWTNHPFGWNYPKSLFDVGG